MPSFVYPVSQQHRLAGGKKTVIGFRDRRDYFGSFRAAIAEARRHDPVAQCCPLGELYRRRNVSAAIGNVMASAADAVRINVGT